MVKGHNPINIYPLKLAQLSLCVVVQSPTLYSGFGSICFWSCL